MRAFFFLIFLFCSACGYHLGEGDITRQYATISLTFAEGDVAGDFTQAVINEIATQTSLIYVNEGADLELYISLVDIDEQNVGFRYDRDKHDKLVKYIIPTETRLKGFVEITLNDPVQGRAILGPTLLEACYDFDHDYYSSRNAVNIFSLGQLTDYDEAYDAAKKPLYQYLARKIVDYIKI